MVSPCCVYDASFCDACMLPICCICGAHMHMWCVLQFMDISYGTYSLCLAYLVPLSCMHVAYMVSVAYMPRMLRMLHTCRIYGAFMLNVCCLSVAQWCLYAACMCIYVAAYMLHVYCVYVAYIVPIIFLLPASAAPMLSVCCIDVGPTCAVVSQG